MDESKCILKPGGWKNNSSSDEGNQISIYDAIITGSFTLSD